MFDIVPRGLRKFLDHSAVDVIMFRMAMEGARELIDAVCEEPGCVIKNALETLKTLGLIHEFEVKDGRAVVRLDDNRRCVIAFILGAISGTMEKKFGKVNIFTPIGKYVSKDAKVTLKAELLQDGIEIRWF